VVEGMLKSIFEGGDQVKGNPQAFRKAAQISADVYKEQGADAAYWEKYFRVVKEKDKQGMEVELGGSSVNNLADNLRLFGLEAGSQNLYAATYTVFGNVVKQQYPDLMPSFAPAGEILDTSYVKALAQKDAPTTRAETQRFEASDRVQQVVSRRSWQIAFDSGKASFTPAAQAELDRLLQDLLVASGTVVEVHGHTDNQGNPSANLQLSEDRAFAVKQWLENRAPVNFPSGRVRVFAHGPTNPVASNTTAEGRAQNRRVEIVLGTTQG
jgi:OOP family OmpA-OmpF porin